jgi:hypothetical protein
VDRASAGGVGCRSPCTAVDTHRTDRAQTQRRPEPGPSSVSPRQCGSLGRRCSTQPKHRTATPHAHTRSAPERPRPERVEQPSAAGKPPAPARHLPGRSGGPRSPRTRGRHQRTARPARPRPPRRRARPRSTHGSEDPGKMTISRFDLTSRGCALGMAARRASTAWWHGQAWQWVQHGCSMLGSMPEYHRFRRPLQNDDLEI